MKKFSILICMLLGLFWYHWSFAYPPVPPSIWIGDIATSAETVTGTETSKAVTPAGLTAKMSAPGAIGNTTPSTGAFSTITSTGVINGTSSLWWDAKSISGVSAAPGASGAAFTAPDANTLGGYRLSDAAHKLYFNESISSMWDGASDLEFKVTFEVNDATPSDGTVDLQLVCYYKGNHDTAHKTQTLEVAHTTTSDKTRYTRHTITFTIDWDKTSHVVEVADKMSFVLNLETDTSEIDDIIINTIMFRYKTIKMNVEV